MQQRIGKYISQADEPPTTAVLLVSDAPANASVGALSLLKMMDLLQPILASMKEATEQRRLRWDDRRRLASAQQDERQTVRGLLQDRRGHMAKALRSVMRTHHLAEQQALLTAHREAGVLTIQPMIEMAKRDPV